jgi:hypothetical protein
MYLSLDPVFVSADFQSPLTGFSMKVIEQVNPILADG